MPVTKIGFNATGVTNTTAPDFNISTNVSQFVNDIPLRANEYTGGFIGSIIMFGLFALLYYRISDPSQFGEFKYSQVRSLGIASGITGVIGLVMYPLGYFTQIYFVMLFIVLFVIAFLLVIKEER